MVQNAIAKCIANWPEAGIQIGAQEHLQKFYHQLGFNNHSEVYLEDGRQFSGHFTLKR